MARRSKNQFLQYWEKYKGQIFVILGVYVIYKYFLRPFGSVGEGIASIVADKVQQVTTPGLNEATPAELAQIRADAKAIAYAFGKTKEQTGIFSLDWANYFTEDEETAVKILGKYKKLTASGQPKKAKYTVAALEAVYPEFTDNRSLKNDVLNFMDEAQYAPLIKALW